jgi:hypothetical protein
MGQHIPTTEPGADKPTDTGVVYYTWDKLPDEPDNWYALFRVYREQGYRNGYTGQLTPRNLDDLTSELGVPAGSLLPGYQKYRWEQRVGAWDREVVRRMAEAKAPDEAKAIRAHQMRIARKARNLGETELDKLLALAATSHEAVLKPRDALAIADWGAKLERGLAATPIAADLGPASSGVPIESMDTETLLELHSILKTGKAKGTP